MAEPQEPLNRLLDRPMCKAMLQAERRRAMRPDPVFAILKRRWLLEMATKKNPMAVRLAMRRPRAARVTDRNCRCNPPEPSE